MGTSISPSDRELAEVQDRLAAAIKASAEMVAAAPNVPAFAPRNEVTQTEVAIVASAMLEAADIEIFELAMWKTWGTPASQGARPTHPPESAAP